MPAIDLGVEGFELDFGDVEERTGDVFAGIVNDVANPALPVRAEDRKTEAVVIQDRRLASFHVGAAVAVVAAPFGDRFGVEI